MGVLDLDSPYLGHFSPQDQSGFEDFVKILEGCIYD